MEILIHGKPNAGSSKVTSDIDGLSQNIIDNYFREMDQIRDAASLVVDARYWKGTWYSIYTYVLGQNIKDTADRKSYFALTVVVPKTYYCLISEVYLQLKKICEGDVFGSILSKNGKYLVQTLDDISIFERIVSKVKGGFVNSNLEEDFDSNFERQDILKNDIYYNINDCDSKAFVSCLRKHGRIIVTETEKTKDELISKINDYIRQYNNAQANIAEKDKQIDSLNMKIEQLGKDLAEANSSTKGKVQKLQEKINSLSAENQSLQVEKEKLSESCNGMREKIGKVSEILGLTKPSYPSEKLSQVKNNLSKKNPKKSNNGWYGVIPLVNTLLLLILVFLMLFHQKGSTNTGNYFVQEPKPISEEGMVSETPKTETNSIIDGKTCELSLFIANTMSPLIGDSVEITNRQPVKIILSHTVESYSFHSENLQNESELKADTAIILNPINKTKPITIWYGSGEKNMANPSNMKVVRTK